MTEPKSDTLPAPGAVLHYDIRSADSSTHPALLIIGSPMGAAGFVTLAGHFADRMVVTYDPRGPDPAAFGLPAEDDGSRNDPLVGQNMISCPHYEHDFGALRAASTRIVVGVGEESGQTVTGRSSVAVAERLGRAPVTFPGGHDGFLGGEYGGAGKPDAFAATLHTLLDHA
jgi:hypothetical protein